MDTPGRQGAEPGRGGTTGLQAVRGALQAWTCATSWRGAQSSTRGPGRGANLLGPWSSCTRTTTSGHPSPYRGAVAAGSRAVYASSYRSMAKAPRSLAQTRPPATFPSGSPTGGGAPGGPSRAGIRPPGRKLRSSGYGPRQRPDMAFPPLPVRRRTDAPLSVYGDGSRPANSPSWPTRFRNRRGASRAGRLL